jgi:5-methylcytosine-specific restriction endonuclease McrA
MRKHLSARRRAEIFNAHAGVCSLCNGRIQAVEAWEIEHTIPVAMGGTDDAENLTVVHVKCHRAKTKEDVGNIAKAKRREGRHMGFVTSKRPLPGSKASGWRRRMDGTVERRDD